MPKNDEPFKWFDPFRNIWKSSRTFESQASREKKIEIKSSDFEVLNWNLECDEDNLDHNFSLDDNNNDESRATELD